MEENVEKKENGKKDRRGRIGRILCLVLILALLLSFIPRHEYYRDGGTEKYTAFWYSVVKWNFLDGPAFDKYKEDEAFGKYFHEDKSTGAAYWKRTDVYLFPQSLKDHGFFETPARYSFCYPK